MDFTDLGRLRGPIDLVSVECEELLQHHLRSAARLNPSNLTSLTSYPNDIGSSTLD